MTQAFRNFRHWFFTILLYTCTVALMFAMLCYITGGWDEVLWKPFLLLSLGASCLPALAFWGDGPPKEGQRHVLPFWE